MSRLPNLPHFTVSLNFTNKKERTGGLVQADVNKYSISDKEAGYLGLLSSVQCVWGGKWPYSHLVCKPVRLCLKKYNKIVPALDQVSRWTAPWEKQTYVKLLAKPCAAYLVTTPFRFHAPERAIASWKFRKGNGPKADLCSLFCSYSWWCPVCNWHLNLLIQTSSVGEIVFR